MSRNICQKKENDFNCQQKLDPMSLLIKVKMIFSHLSLEFMEEYLVAR